MSLVVASILALLVGPALVAAFGARGRVLAALDGFVLAALFGVVATQLLPQSFALGGGWAVGAAAVGLVAPPLIERSVERVAGPWHRLMLLSAMVGLAVHAMLDGAAIASETGGDDKLLTVGVLLHRIPDGLAVWWAARPRAGRASALALLGLVALGTAVGFAGAGPLLDELPLTALSSFQALVAGSLLHVVVGHEPEALVRLVRGNKPYASAGALAGIAVVVGLNLVHHPHGQTGGFVPTFLSLAHASAPALLLAFAGASMLAAIRPAAAAPPPAADSAAIQAMRGLWLGARTTRRSSDVLPVYRRLLTRGATGSAAIAFVVAAPSLGLDAVLVSLPLLGFDLALTRLALVIAVAWLAGVTLGPPMSRPLGESSSCGSVAPIDHAASPLAARMRAALGHGFGKLADHVLPWFVVGLSVASWLAPVLAPGSLAALPGWLGVASMALLGLGGYFIASAAMPVAAVLIHHGLSPGAALAFLLTAPIGGAAAISGLGRVHGRSAALRIVLLVTLGAIAAGLAYDAIGAGRAARALPPPGERWELAALVALAVVFLCSLFRQGPRALVGRVLAPHQEQHPHAHVVAPRGVK
jgi:hypothetical protein